MVPRKKRDPAKYVKFELYDNFNKELQKESAIFETGTKLDIKRLPVLRKFQPTGTVKYIPKQDVRKGHALKVWEPLDIDTDSEEECKIYGKRYIPKDGKPKKTKKTTN